MPDDLTNEQVKKAYRIWQVLEFLSNDWHIDRAFLGMVWLHAFNVLGVDHAHEMMRQYREKFDISELEMMSCIEDQAAALRRPLPSPPGAD